MQMHNKLKVETWLPSACIVEIPILYVHASYWRFELKVCVCRRAFHEAYKTGSFARSAFV